MANPSTFPPPRLAPYRPFPRYAYVPGRTPHPTRDPDGHSYGVQLDLPEPPDPAEWRTCRDYLYGIDLFNYGYFWEAHEAWEGLWVACGRRGPTATYLQALINLAATGFKARWGSARGMRANAETTVRLFKSLASQLGSTKARYMGLDTRKLARYAEKIAKAPPTPQTAPGDGKLPTFDLLLWPD